MIKRVYIDNFHCFTNFEIKLENNPSALFMGKNGVGKSSLFSALLILQKIANGDNNLAQSIKKQDFGLLGINHPVTFEFDIEKNKKNFSYKLIIEYPDKFYQPRIKEENLTVDGKACFTRNQASISVGKAKFSLDWHIAALPIIQAAPNDNVTIFRDWLKNMLLIAPNPRLMTGITNQEAGISLKVSGSNFVSWLSHILGQYPHLYSYIDKYTKDFFSDFSCFIFQDVGKDSRELELQFEKNNKTFTIAFDCLSDGEKLIFMSGAIFAFAQKESNSFCFWDEPNNYISASIMDNFIRKLLSGFEKKSSQFWVISHNIEVIAGFNDDNSWVFRRNDHTSATLPPKNIAELRKSKAFDGDLTMGILTGDIYDA